MGDAGGSAPRSAFELEDGIKVQDAAGDGPYIRGHADHSCEKRHDLISLLGISVRQIAAIRIGRPGLGSRPFCCDFRLNVPLVFNVEISGYRRSGFDAKRCATLTQINLYTVRFNL